MSLDFKKIEGADNVKVAVKGDVIYLKINTGVEGKVSSSGVAAILAQTNRFVSLADATDIDVGLNLVLTRKIVKNKQKDKSSADKPAKRKAKRKDDDDD